MIVIDELIRWVRKKFPKRRVWIPIVIVILVGAMFITAIIQELSSKAVDRADKSASKPVVGPVISVPPPRTDASLVAIRQLPPPPDPFVGRQEELTQLRRAVLENKASVIVIRGMGGVGKTALALKFASEVAPRYADAQIFLDLKGTSEPLTPRQAMEHVIRAFHPKKKLPETKDQIAGLYRSVLSDKRTLLLMDNARDAAQVAPLSPPGENLMLVTSRQSFAIGGSTVIDLDVLPFEMATKLLLKLCPRIGEDADEIAKACGGLPLALKLAAGALAARKTMSVEDYIAALSDEKTRVATLDKYANLTDAEKTVEAAFSQSYELLSNDLKKSWRELAVFPRDFISAATEAVWEAEDEVVRDRLGDLVACHLLDSEKEANRYRLHDLARDFATARLAENSEEEYAAAKRHAAHFLQVLRVADDLYLKGDDNVLLGLSVFDTERANIERGFEWAAARVETDDVAARMTTDYPLAGVYCLALRQHPRTESIPWLKKALEAAGKLDDKGAEGSHIGNLGNAYNDLGETKKAIGYYNKRLAIAREIGDRRGEGRTLGNLGVVYDKLGETEKAIEYYENVLLIARDTGDRMSEGNALGNMGIAYDKLGETEKAIELHEKALSIAREIGDRRGEGRTLGNLGSAYLELGKTEKAIEHYKEELVIVHEIGDRRGEGGTVGNLGIAYARLGETKEAIENFEKAIVICREIGYRMGEGTALWNKAIVLDTLKRRDEAIECAEEALAILGAIDDPDMEKVRAKLAEWRKE